MELTAQLAVAPAARAALWRSRGGGARLEELPLAVTGFDDDAFFQEHRHFYHWGIAEAAARWAGAALRAGVAR